jgi:hypothetical protein
MPRSQSALPSIPGSSTIKLSLTILSAVLAFVPFLAGLMAQAQNSRGVLITQSVDESRLVTLAGNTRPEANKQNDRGLVADNLSMEHMLLQLKRSPAQERALLQYIEDLQNHSSPNFHHWLTAKEFGEKYGLATQDLDSITHWLESHGLKVNLVYESGILLDFSGTAGQVRSAFHTEIHQLDVKGVKHLANMSDPRIPAALAPAVVGVVSLHDFKPHTNYKPRANYTFPDPEGGTSYAVVPGDLATIYNLNPLFTASISGQGQTVVVIEDTDLYATSDWTNFRSTFGLSAYTDGSLTQVHPAPLTGPNNCADPGVNPDGDDGEAIIDAEYASAAAPSATIEVASCNNTETTFGGLIAIQNLLNGASAPPAIMSISYGECEAFNGASSNSMYNSTYQQAVTEGVSVFVSTGDEGAAGCDPDQSIATHGIGVSAFASTPNNVAVGGTDFSDTFSGTNATYWSATNSPTFESAISYVPEIPWNDSCASVVAAEFFDFAQTYGSTGFCNSRTGEENLTTSSGSGGPSGCASGSPAVSGVVGGTCQGWPKPSYQLVFGNPTDSVRDTPDVSLFAGNGIWGHFYPFCFTDPKNGGSSCAGAPSTWPGAGGTSFASPIMAGIQALVNQKVGVRQGNPNTVYYSLAATEYGASGNSSCSATLGNAVGSSCIFYDVTQGDMDVNCTGAHNCYLPSGTNGVLSTSNSAYQPAYATTSGWDFATGIGTVNAANLANAWPSDLSSTSTTLTTSAPPPTGAIQGATVTFTATVTTQGANLPTGTVNFNDGSTTIGSGTLNGSQVATFATNSLAVGTHSITAVYLGDTNNAGSTSTPVSQVITAIVTSTTLVSSVNPANYGASVTFTATVTTTGTHKPTGTVTFDNGNTALGMGTLNGSGVATFTTAALPAGANSITAVYNGDLNNSSSTSGILTENINSPNFALTNTGVTSTTVLAGVKGAGYAFTVAPVPPAANFGGPVTLSCTFAPTDPTLTASSCVFTGGQIQNNIIPATAGTTQVTLAIATAGPNPDPGVERRRRADNRSPWLPLVFPLAGIVMAGFAGRKISKHSALAGLCVSLALLGLLVACGGSSSPPVTVFVGPGVPAAVFPNNSADNWPLQTAQFSATVGNTTNTGVTWAVTTPNGGTISASGLYTAPQVAAGLPTSVTITATSMADSTKTGSAQLTLKPATIPTQLQPGQQPYTVTVTATTPFTAHNVSPTYTLIVN